MTRYLDDGLTILRFSRKTEHGFDHLPLSNFYPSPIPAPRGQIARTVEHYYQAAKTSDPATQDAILAAKTAGQAKELGQQVELRPDWDLRRLTVMRRAIAKKFDDHESGLGLWLARTDPWTIVEGNVWHDTFWGAVEVEPGVWEGDNWLGTLLMARRSELVSALLCCKVKNFDELLAYHPDDEDHGLYTDSGPGSDRDSGDSETPVSVAAAGTAGPAERRCEVRDCAGSENCAVEDEFAGAFDADDFYETTDMARCARIRAEDADTPLTNTSATH